MALKFNQKIERSTTFLIAFGDRRTMMAMRRAGLTPADLAQGWKLAQTAATPWFEEGPEIEDTPEARLALDELDALENEFFPVADASLVRRYPGLHRKVIGRLSQTSGPALLLTMPRFVANIRALEEAGDPESREARALLAKRGLTTDVLERIEALIALASAPNMTPAPISDDELARQSAAREENVQRLWDWYREWSAIARARVKDGRVLYRLGFGRPGRPAADLVDEDEDEPPTEPTPPSA